MAPMVPRRAPVAAIGDAEGVAVGGGVLLIGAAFIGLIGFAIWTRYRLLSDITAKHGVGGALKYQAGETAIGVAGSWLARPYGRNGRRRKRRKGKRR